MSEAEKKDGADGTEVPEVFSGNNVRASWPFSLHTIRANIAHCSPEGKQALVSAFLWCTDAKHQVSRDDFAKRVGYSPNVIYKLLSGKYTHPENKTQLDVPAALISAIRHFLDLERERFLGGNTQFVKTRSSQKIWNACDLARESRTPVFLWGPPQYGKTWALEAYTADNNHGRTVYCRMHAASGLGGMIRRICAQLGVSPNSNTTDLTDRIKNALTSDMILIFDEVHLLMYTYRKQSFFGCMEVLREIYDEVGCGMIFCGTLLLEEKLKCRELEQLLKRGVHRIMLPAAPTKSDIAAILSHHRLEFPKRDAVIVVQDVREKPYEVLRQLARNNGLKAVTERIRYATKLASKDGKKLTGERGWEYFIEAHLTIETEATPTESWE